MVHIIKTIQAYTDCFGEDHPLNYSVIIENIDAYMSQETRHGNNYWEVGRYLIECGHNLSETARVFKISRETAWRISEVVLVYDEKEYYKEGF